jgi:mono/diheme cytochrome c family protein
VYRGNSLPEDLRGDLIIPEPVGRLIRRAKVINTDGMISLKNAYNQEEFIASADMNFRPVNSATGPDGCLYIVDMNHGIIQESNWTKPGTYLRKQIESKKLDKNIGRGRIYRLVYRGIKPDKNPPNMLNQPSNKLVQYLAHANGWWRETAQKLMVVRADKSIAPQLTDLALNSPSHLARIHALWTLDGLASLDKTTLLLAFKDENAQVRKTALWIGEAAIRTGNEQVISAIQPLINDPSVDVRFQLALSLRFSKSEKAQKVLAELLGLYPDNKILIASQKSFQRGLDAKLASEQKTKLMAEEDQKLVRQGAAIFKQLCATCHGADGKGINNGGKDMPAPPLAANKNVSGDPEKIIRILLHGLSGPVNGKTYADVMPALGYNDDEYLASVISYIRTDLDNKASIVKPGDVKKIRGMTAARKSSWTWKELNNLQ